MGHAGRALCQLLALAALACSVLAQAQSLSELELTCPDYITRFAPLVWLHSDDPYKPSDTLAHVQHTKPWLNGEPVPDLPALDLNNLDKLNDQQGEVFLTANDDPTTQPAWLMGQTPDASGRIHDSVPCWVILVNKGETDVDAFYFYFYSYNEGPNITQVLEPFDKLVRGTKAESGMHFGNHVGDWEHNMIRFRNEKPIGIYYSQHEGGKAYNWDDSTVTKKDGRPIVYSARGSHANYATSGLQVHHSVILDLCDEGQIWDPVLSAYFYRLEPSNFTLNGLANPMNDSSKSPSPVAAFYFEGRWGDESYRDSDPRQETIPRFGLRRFETGPTGPRAKQLLRKGILPILKKKSWLEFLVGIYMSLYPCCIKGWRAWISMSVVIAAFAGVVILVVMGVRRVRRGPKTQYTKIAGDDIPLDDWRADDVEFSSSEDEEESSRQGNAAKTT